MATKREEALDQRRSQTSFHSELAHDQMVAACEKVSRVHEGEEVKLRKKIKKMRKREKRKKNERRNKKERKKEKDKEKDKDKDKEKLSRRKR